MRLTGWDGRFLRFCGAAALSVLGFLTGAQAAPLHLMMPVACTPERDCWIVNYVDTNPAAGQAQDYTCGPATYDGHDGTDFGIRDIHQMRQEVSVLAAAPGRVEHVRDGMPDGQPTAAEMEKMLRESRGCGNGILIDHGDGWKSIYCQLKSGSIVVKTGDQVSAGQQIAAVGQSGAASFPQLHFGLFHDGRTIDPFSGNAASAGCGAAPAALWDLGITLPYAPMASFASGFVAGLPDFDRIRADAAAQALKQTSPAIDTLSFWAGFYGLRPGDRVRLSITAPDGSLYARQDEEQKDGLGRQYYYVGRNIGDPLLPGVYTGRAVATRTLPNGGTLTRTAESRIEVINPIAHPDRD